MFIVYLLYHMTYIEDIFYNRLSESNRPIIPVKQFKDLRLKMSSHVWCLCLDI